MTLRAEPETPRRIPIHAALVRPVLFAGADRELALANGIVCLALIMGIVNSFVAPIIKLLSLPFIIITLGLFLLLINALMLFFTEWLVGLFDIDFYVDGFWNAVGGAIVITVVTWIVGFFIGGTEDA